MITEQEIERRFNLFNQGYWEIPDGLDTSNFDFDWRPEPYDRPYIHQFGTQWQKTGGPRFIIPENEGIKFNDSQRAIKLPAMESRNWRPLKPNVSIDWSWHPDECDPPYIYVFGNQWYDVHTMPTIQYRVKGATEKKYITDIRARLDPCMDRWVIPESIKDDFDYSWVPHPDEPPFIWQFGTQWQDTGGPKYCAPDATVIKYSSILKAEKLPEFKNWDIPDDIEPESFDYSWHPDDRDPAFIYQFGTQHQKNGGPKYITPGATLVKYSDILVAKKKSNPDKRNWRPLVSNIDFDYSWHPDEDEPPYIYVFGNQHYGPDLMPTLLYRVKGATEKKYMDMQVTLLPDMSKWIVPDDIEEGFDYSWVPHPHEPKGFIWQFGTQHQKNGGPQYIDKDATIKKYTTEQVAIKKNSKEKRNWRPLVSNIDFDYSWHPDEDEPPYIYVFGNQWYDAVTMPTVTYKVPGATTKKFINDVRATLLPNKDKWIVPEEVDDTNWDYSWVPNPNEGSFIYQFGTQHQKTGGHRYVCENATLVKYIDIMQSTRIADMRKWRIIEEIDKDTFDFSWHPDDTEGLFNYVFGNKFHTAEFMPSVTYRGKNTVDNKYISDIRADLRIEKKSFEDSIFEQAMIDKFDTKYVHYQNTEHPLDYSMIIPEYNPERVYLHIIDNHAAIIPKGFKAHLYDNLSDYPYIKRHELGTYVKPLDIVFFSNGESCAEENYQHLLSLNLPNRIVRVDGVQGRVASQHSAANASKTPWYFLVNAKLKVSKDFDFNWQPDIMKSRRHYIFSAKNPINHLEYGHMAIVANNKKLTLSTQGIGLDFTMESKTEVVDMLSGTAIFNSSWDVWRTAFRECIKLRHNKDNESTIRLASWTTIAEGEFAQDSLQGARDAISYYEEVNGDFEKLKLSYDWAWLKERYTK